MEGWPLKQLTEEQGSRLQQIQQLSKKFAKRAHEIDRTGEFPYENIRELIECGYSSLTLPQKYGGEGISLAELLLLQETIARGCGSTALAIGWHLGIIMDMNDKLPWQGEDFDELMKQVKAGALVNRAASEPMTGSPTRGGKPETTARKTEEGWMINGRKTFTTLAPVLDYFMVSASVEEEGWVGEFLVPKGTEGVSIAETWDLVAMRGTGSHDLLLENVVVPSNHLIQEVKKEAKKGSGWLLHIPACYLGIAIHARDIALEFATSYSPNSIKGTISELPHVQRLIGEIELQLKQARGYMYYIAEAWDCLDSKETLQEDLATVKHQATNTAISVVDKAMRIVGARSLSEKHPLQRLYRDVRAGLHNPPMDDAVIALLAQKALEGSENN